MVFLKQWYKLTWPQQTFFRVLPAHQNFCSHHFSGLHIAFWLHIDFKFLVLYPGCHAVCDLLLSQQIFPHSLPVHSHMVVISFDRIQSHQGPVAHTPRCRLLCVHPIDANRGNRLGVQGLIAEDPKYPLHRDLFLVCGNTECKDIIPQIPRNMCFLTDQAF